MCVSSTAVLEILLTLYHMFWPVFENNDHLKFRDYLKILKTTKYRLSSFRLSSDLVLQNVMKLGHNRRAAHEGAIKPSIRSSVCPSAISRIFATKNKLFKHTSVTLRCKLCMHPSTENLWVCIQASKKLVTVLCHKRGCTCIRSQRTIHSFRPYAKSYVQLQSRQGFCEANLRFFLSSGQWILKLIMCFIGTGTSNLGSLGSFCLVSAMYSISSRLVSLSQSNIACFYDQSTYILLLNTTEAALSILLIKSVPRFCDSRYPLPIFFVATASLYISTLDYLNSKAACFL